jgi:hypothetical protein
MVVVFEPDKILTGAEMTRKQRAKEKKDKAKAAKAALKEQKAKEKAKKKALKAGKPYKEDETSLLIKTFLQTFEMLQITRLHIRLQDPTAHPPTAITLCLGSTDLCGKRSVHAVALSSHKLSPGGVRIFEPTSSPKSFLSVLDENKGAVTRT